MQKGWCVANKALSREEPESYSQTSVFESVYGDVSCSEGETLGGADPFRWSQIKLCPKDEATA